MTNGERADRLFSEALDVADEMGRALERHSWNLAARRAQDLVELVTKALLAELSVEYPKTHDPAPLLVRTIRERHLEADAAFLEWLVPVSARLAEIRAPAFYQEIAVSETDAGEAVASAARVLGFGREFLARLRNA